MASVNISDWLNSTDFFLTAEQVICAYPISDTYAPLPRYLYYVVLALVFIIPRRNRIVKVFLGAAVAYAATAAINALIIVSNQPKTHAAEEVTIPYVSSNNGTIQARGLVTNTTTVTVQPDAVELDLDTITAIVVVAYLTGLPLQAWSRTVRSSQVVHYMLHVWNAMMLVATISALVAWPDTNTAPPQYRFCFYGFQDLDTQQSNGWQSEYWKGSWNATIYDLFGSPYGDWQNLTYNCLYPCFNTSQVIRQSSSLKATVKGSDSKFAKLHDPDRYGSDPFQFLIYVAISVFTAAQIFLLIVARLRLCSHFVPIYEPSRLWRRRRSIHRNFKDEFWESVKVIHLLSRRFRRKIQRRSRSEAGLDPLDVKRSDLKIPLRFCLDFCTIVILIASLTLFPITVISFICWIEWYIRNDGTPNESSKQVGQWSAVVSLAVVLLAALTYHNFKDMLASREELMHDIEEHTKRLDALRRRLRVQDEKVTELGR